MSAPKHDKIELKYVATDDCEANDWNAQEMDGKTFERLKEEIAENGFIVPIQVVKAPNGKYRIIGGEHRWRVAKELGIKEIPAGIIDGAKWSDTDLQKFVTVRLNILSGQLNPDKFVTLYTEMAEKYGAESMQNLMGFTDTQAFAKALGGVKKGLKKALPPEMHAAVDAAAKEAKSVADLGNIIQMLFSQYGDTVAQSFMIFTYGKQNHVYIQMDKPLKKLLDKVIDFTRATGQDINAVLQTVMEPGVKGLSEKLEKTPPKGALQDGADSDGPEY